MYNKEKWNNNYRWEEIGDEEEGRRKDFWKDGEFEGWGKINNLYKKKDGRGEENLRKRKCD